MNNQFSDNLKKIRKEHNLSQEELAEELGVSRQAISKWESGSAYPEMDKIIAMCDKFNLNIDDLLHKDIKEAKVEEEGKKKINNIIDDFLKFITDSINMFSNMNFKSKFKCLFEQFVIAFILFLASMVVYYIIDDLVFDNLHAILPRVLDPSITFLQSIVGVALLIISVIILVHTFKTRYLDYYLKIKNESIKEETTEEKKEESNEEVKEEKTSKKEKISFNREDKIIIRDPKHSEYRFINALLKIIIGIIKFFLLIFSLFIIAVIIGLFCAFVVSFLLYKTGFLFIGLLVTTLSSGFIATLFLLLILNFVFNRKSNKKFMIWGFILGLIAFGIGCGLIFMGSLNIDVHFDDYEYYSLETTEHNMNKDLVLNIYSEKDTEYIEENRSNVKIEYYYGNYCDLKEHVSENGVYINAYTECNNPTKVIKTFINNINDKKVIEISPEIYVTKVYASKENIQIIKKNTDKYYEKISEEE